MTRPHDPYGVARARRVFDVLVCLPLLVLAAPLLAVAILLILLTDGRPVFFHQTRVGQGGRTFRLCKLRSMRTGPAGPSVTCKRDPRVTRLGAVLRRTSIDELPQLWHVLRGQMTLVGPRPESQDLASRYPASCRQVLLARPGLTGPAQLRYREGSNTVAPGVDPEAWYLTVIVPLRTEADLEYLRRPTLLATLRYLALTALFVTGLVDLTRDTGRLSPPASRPAAEAR
jgi:lipopolysaccharide/colanic/teichoic acid biosynthesis glycosyltransferase